MSLSFRRISSEIENITIIKASIYYPARNVLFIKKLIIMGKAFSRTLALVTSHRFVTRKRKNRKKRKTQCSITCERPTITPQNHLPSSIKNSKSHPSRTKMCFMQKENCLFRNMK